MELRCAAVEDLAKVEAEDLVKVEVEHLAKVEAEDLAEGEVEDLAEAEDMAAEGRRRRNAAAGCLSNVMEQDGVVEAGRLLVMDSVAEAVEDFGEEAVLTLLAEDDLRSDRRGFVEAEEICGARIAGRPGERHVAAIEDFEVAPGAALEAAPGAVAAAPVMEMVKVVRRNGPRGEAPAAAAVGMVVGHGRRIKAVEMLRQIIVTNK